MASAFTYPATLPHLFNRRRLLEKNYIFAYLDYLDFATLTRTQLRYFNLKNDDYIISQCTSYFY